MNQVEIAKVSHKSLRIKGKYSVFLVDPILKMPKTTADGIILLNGEADLSKVEGARLVIKDPGEYEIGTAQIEGIKEGNNLFFNLKIDNVEVILGRASSIGLFEKVREPQVLVLNADSDLNESLVTSLEPKILALYGEKAEKGILLLGKNADRLQKISVTSDKLPEEMQIVWLT